MFWPKRTYGRYWSKYTDGTIGTTWIRVGRWCAFRIRVYQWPVQFDFVRIKD